MFDNFTFGAVSQMRHDDIITASPTDLSFATPPTSYPFSPDTLEDLSDIVQQFSKQSLTRDERAREFAAWREAINVPLEVDSDEEMSSLEPTTSAPSPASHLPLGGSIACRRMQRQLNTQLQLSTTHMRDISTLVEDMISSNSQCRLQQRSPRSPTRSAKSPSPHELDVDPMDNGCLDKGVEVDEGFFDTAELKIEEELSLRRASAPSGIRKYGPMKWGRSADVCIGGRAKVKSRPRMRKRSVTKSE